MSEQADASRLIEWINDPNRKHANIAFTEGPERQVAYAIEGLFGKTGFCAQCEAYAKERDELRRLLGQERDAFGRKETELIGERDRYKKALELMASPHYHAGARRQCNCSRNAKDALGND